MKQILHIFCKDVRHHWVVILLCQAALVLYCWEEVSSWSERVEFGFSAFSELTRMLPLLAWCFFMIRMVQDEPLVGDRQFWVTRPYEWKKLLAEKVLLVLVFVNVPMLIAEAFLLAKAGFSPAPHLLGLVWMQLLLLLIPLLPLLALASVTRTLASALIALFAVVLFLMGMSLVPLFVRGHALYAMNVAGVSFPVERNLDGLGIGVTALVCLTAAFLQYARRWTFPSRLLLIGGLLATEAITLASPYVASHRDVTQMPTGAFHAALDPVKLLPPKAPAEENELVPIGIPVVASGLPAGSLGEIRGVKVVLEGPGGIRWEGRWQSNLQLLTPGDNRWRPIYEMEHEAYARLKNIPLKARVTVRVDVFREHGFEIVRASTGEFAVPGVGWCRVWDRSRHGLRCNSPLAQPAMVAVRIDPASSTCPIEDVGPPMPVYGLPYAWQRGRGFSTLGGITPVAPSYFNFWYFNDSANICPGTPLSFNFPEFVETARSEFEIENVNLDDFRQANFEGSIMRAADGTRLGLPPLR